MYITMQSASGLFFCMMARDGFMYVRACVRAGGRACVQVNWVCTLKLTWDGLDMSFEALSSKKSGAEVMRSRARGATQIHTPEDTNEGGRGEGEERAGGSLWFRGGLSGHTGCTDHAPMRAGSAPQAAA